MELNKVVLQIYPDIDLIDTVILQNDGQGAYIARWDDPRSQPSEAELQAAWVEYEAGAVDRAKAKALPKAAQMATDKRFEYITPNKDATYVQQQKEVDRWTGAGKPADIDPVDYPYANNRAGVISTTIPAVLTEWEATISQWRTIDLYIEASYTRAIIAIDAASNLTDIEAALTQMGAELGVL